MPINVRLSNINLFVVFHVCRQIYIDKCLYRLAFLEHSIVPEANRKVITAEKVVKIIE